MAEGFDFGKLLNSENLAIVSEVLKAYNELKPLITKRVVGWLNASESSLKMIADNLTPERAEELRKLLDEKLGKRKGKGQ